MEYVRVINSEHWDPERGEFKSFVFRKLHGGISVFDRECAENTSSSICQHIEKYYSSIVGTPVVFWIIDSNSLPDDCLIEPSPSTTGDDCHADIVDLSDNRARKFVKKAWKESPENFYKCGEAYAHTNELDL